MLLSQQSSSKKDTSMAGLVTTKQKWAGRRKTFKNMIQSGTARLSPFERAETREQQDTAAVMPGAVHVSGMGGAAESTTGTSRVDSVSEPNPPRHLTTPMLEAHLVDTPQAHKLRLLFQRLQRKSDPPKRRRSDSPTNGFAAWCSFCFSCLL